jgi:hypothetical protein
LARASHVERRQRRAESQCRRFRQAFVDLGLDHLNDWVDAAGGAVNFGDLEPRKAERLVEIFEILAARARRESR